MLDIKLIRDNPGMVEVLLGKRGEKITLGELLGWDKERRKLVVEIDGLREKRNSASERISQLKQNNKKIRSSGKDVEKLMCEMNNVREQIKEKGKYLSDFDRKIGDFLLRLPNLPAPLRAKPKGAGRRCSDRGGSHPA